MDTSPKPSSKPSSKPSCIAFQGIHRVASGSLRDVALAVKEIALRDEAATFLIFDSATSQPVELDLRGTLDEVAARFDSEPTEADPSAPAASASAAASKRRGPGRPKLGVVGREVTLLPRHWDWLNGQPGGASVTLRKLVEQARRAGATADRARLARESTYRFMSSIAGNQPGFEEATRSLFGDRADAFLENTADWPEDVREHARRLAEAAFAGGESRA